MGSWHRRLAAIGFALTLPALLTGCAGKRQLSAKTMCEAHGASYSAQAQQCNYPPQQPPRNVTDICLAHGGTYDPIGQTCVLEMERWR
jgi:hypothetical protein